MSTHPRHSIALLAAIAAAPAFAADESHGPSGPYGQVAGGGNYAREQDFGTAGGSLDYEAGGLGSLSLGYAFANGLRPEVEYALRRNDADDASGYAEANGAMANLWYDLRAPSFAPRLRPYVGGGAGGAEVSLEEFAGPTGARRDAEETVTAYQAGAGVSYDATRNLVLSLGYRFLETEKAQFADAVAATPAVGLVPGTPGSAAIEERYRSDGVLAGLRYVFGGRDGAPRTASAEPAGAEAAAFETVVLRPVNFQVNRAELTDPSKATLDEIAQRLASHQDMKVLIEGYTDASGSAQYNKQLGRQRAEAVRAYLAGRGVAAGNMEIASRGPANPVADNATEEGRARNRRAELKPQDRSADVKIVIEPPTEESVEAAGEAQR
jgi:outer membrane protein OmpA-like peptidoglycan-associated protein